MTRSQEIAAAVALRAAGYRVHVEPDRRPGRAGRRRRPGGREAAADGRHRLGRGPEGSVAGRSAQRDRRRAAARARTCGWSCAAARAQTPLTVGTIADPKDPKRAIIGVFVAPAASIKLPLKVKIDAGTSAGRPPGSPFALDVLERAGQGRRPRPEDRRHRRDRPRRQRRARRGHQAEDDRRPQRPESGSSSFPAGENAARGSPLRARRADRACA